MTDLLQYTSPKLPSRILAADDDPIMCEMMKARLGDDVEVTCAENGEIAWEKLLAENFDLAIIDLGMPKLDGFGLIRYLRQTPKTVDLPIIVATSRGDSDAIQQAFSAGASGFVTKPFNWSLFKYNIQFLLKRGTEEKLVRADRTTSELTNRRKDNLLGLMAGLLKKVISTGQITAANSDLSDLLQLCDLLSSSLTIKFSSQDVNDLVTNSVNHCQVAANKKSVNLVGRRSLTNISVNVDPAIWSDALNRLVLQGIESSPAGGTVEIMLGRQSDNSLVFSVRDNGPIESQSKIDARLNILLNNNLIGDRPVDLPDLSLPIIKHCVSLHGGRALFQNQTGAGNISALWLPASRVQRIHDKEIAQFA